MQNIHIDSQLKIYLHTHIDSCVYVLEFVGWGYEGGVMDTTNSKPKVSALILQLHLLFSCIFPQVFFSFLA